MATAQQIKAYQRKLETLLKQADRFDDRAVREVMSLLRNTRDRVASAIVSAEGFEMVHLERIQNAVNDAFRQFNNQYRGVMLDGGLSAYQMGGSLIDSPLEAAGMQMAVSAMPVMGETHLRMIQGLSADLIQDVSEESINKINRTLQIAMLGEKTPFQVMGEIGRNIDKGTFKSVANRAEVITRTEINRFLNLGTQKRFEMAAEVVPELRKYWMHTQDLRTRSSHIAVGRRTNPGLGGRPITEKAKFSVGGRQCSGPHDPVLPAKEQINCRCRLGTIMKETKQKEETLFPTPKPPKKIVSKPKPQAKGFVPAKTVKEAEDWARQNLKTEIGSMKGVNLNVGNQVLKSIAEIESKTKNKIKLKVDFKGVSGGAYASYDWESGTLLLRKNYRNLEQRLLKNDIEWKKQYGKHYQISNDLDGIIKHEFGHAYDHFTERKLYKEISSLDIQLQNKAYGVSGYAPEGRFWMDKQLKGTEMIAELINAKLTNHFAYDKLPVEIKNIIDREFK